MREKILPYHMCWIEERRAHGRGGEGQVGSLNVGEINYLKKEEVLQSCSKAWLTSKSTILEVIGVGGKGESGRLVEKGFS